MGGSPRRRARWVRRFVVALAMAGTATALRARMLAANARRYGLPG